MQLPSDLKWLLDAYHKDYSRVAPNNVEKIRLNQLVSKLGFFYEKFRNAIDYNDEHLVRRNALERLLRRQMFFIKEQNSIKISQAVIFEFIRARYLPNDTLPETIITEGGVIIAKYLKILNYLNNHRHAENTKIADWVVTMAASEVDEYLIAPDKALAMVNFMYSRMVETLYITNTTIDEKEKNLQIYLAVLKTLVRADTTQLRYRLLRLYNPNWDTISDDQLLNFCQHISATKHRIDQHLNHPINFQLAHVVRRQSVFFTILREVIEKNESNEKLFTSEAELTEQIDLVCTTNYKKIKNKLVGSIFRVILYILFTKTILAFLIELPYDKIFVGKIHWEALAINVLFHPFLMFVVAMTITVPGNKNTQIIIDEIKKIVSGTERRQVIKIKRSLKRGSASYIIFNAIYALMFAISFGIIIEILRKLDFNIMSGTLFVFFLTVVSFFGFRLRNLAKQLSVIPRKDNLFNFVIDFFSLPIIRVGRFFSSNFAKVNIFLFILDFIIETPFKLLVEFLERAMSFVKDKREEIVE
jgi:hypothetical protein